jgi:hypothetical protein
MREDAKGNRKRILKGSASERDQHCEPKCFIARKRSEEIPNRSQVTAAEGASRRQVAVVLETVTATDSRFQKWNT